MYLDAQTLITAGSVLTALAAGGAVLVKVVKWYARQNEQDKELKEIRATHAADMKATRGELTLITYGLLACLKGMKEQGCNGPVTEAIGKMEKHLNMEAHK